MMKQLRQVTFLAVLVGLVAILGCAEDKDYYSTTVGPSPEPEWTPTWRVPEHFPTIQEAIDSPAVLPGHKIVVDPGEWHGATVTKGVEFVGEEGATIVRGPVEVAGSLQVGFYFPGDYAGSGATIRGFTFQGVPQPDREVDDGYLDFPIYSHRADDVTVKDNVMGDSLQAITNWHGSGWKIYNNTIEGLWVLGGGGIGIFVGSRDGPQANGNFIDSNEVAASIEADSLDYDTAGICLMSDARYGQPGGPVQSNTILQNVAAVTATYEGNPTETGIGVELTDIGWVPGNGEPYVKGNVVKLNALEESTVPLALNPPELAEHNDIDIVLPTPEGITLTGPRIHSPQPF